MPRQLGPGLEPQRPSLRCVRGGAASPQRWCASQGPEGPLQEWGPPTEAHCALAVWGGGAGRCGATSPRRWCASQGSLGPVGSAHSFAGTLPEGGTCAAGHVAQPSPPVGSRTLVCSPRALSVNAAAAGRALRVSPGTSAPVGTLPRPPPAHLCVGLCGWTQPGSPSRRASGAHLAPPPAPLPSAAARPAKPSFLSALPVGREEYALAGAGAGTLVHGQEALCFRQGREGTGDRCGCPRPPVPPACPVGGCLPGLQTLQPGPWAPPSGWSWRCSRWLHFLTHRPGGCCPQSPAPPTAPPATPSALAWCSIGFSCPAALGQAVSPHPVLGAAPMTVGHRLRNSPQEELSVGAGTAHGSSFLC